MLLVPPCSKLSQDPSEEKDYAILPRPLPPHSQTDPASVVNNFSPSDFKAASRLPPTSPSFIAPKPIFWSSRRGSDRGRKRERIFTFHPLSHLHRLLLLIEGGGSTTQPLPTKVTFFTLLPAPPSLKAPPLKWTAEEGGREEGGK